MARKSSRQKIEKHKQSLGDTLEDPETHGVRTRPRQKAKSRNHELPSDDEEGPGPSLPSDLTNKIMREAHLQQEELRQDSKEKRREAYQASLAGAIQNLGGEQRDGGLDSDEDGFEDDFEEGLEEEWAEEVEAEDEAVLAAFRTEGGSGGTRTLADMIMEKIREKEQGGVRYVRLMLADPVVFQVVGSSDPCDRRVHDVQPLCTVPSPSVGECRSGGLREKWHRDVFVLPRVFVACW